MRVGGREGDRRAQPDVTDEEHERLVANDLLPDVGNDGQVEGVVRRAVWWVVGRVGGEGRGRDVQEMFEVKDCENPRGCEAAGRHRHVMLSCPE